MVVVTKANTHSSLLLPVREVFHHCLVPFLIWNMSLSSSVIAVAFWFSEKFLKRQEFCFLVITVILDLKEARMNKCSYMRSPHATETQKFETSADESRAHRPATEGRRHRSAVGRVVYMAQDRPDLGDNWLSKKREMKCW